MQWDDTDNAGFSTGKPWLPVYDDYKEYNVASETEDDNSILNCYLSLAELRNKHPELVKDKELIFCSNGKNLKGILEPLQAVVFSNH